MKDELSIAERHFLDRVLKELKQYQINLSERNLVKQQLLEHFHEAHEHGDDSLVNLGDVSSFVQDYLEINGIRNPNKKKKPLFLIVIGFITSIVTYLISQLTLTLFLTDSFSQKNHTSFHYNIFHNIASNPWWNGLLMMISISITILVTFLSIYFISKQLKKG
jgi:hypothetical protein